LKRNHDKLDDIQVIEKVLQSLSSKFEHVFVAIEVYSKDLEKLKNRSCWVHYKYMSKGCRRILILLYWNTH